ncbi:MAG: hypothetical protein K2X01_05025 [Cyanobacteria bacterium]|nr:hypothetical protein [Cyanobacteriota bacterium]
MSLQPSNKAPFASLNLGHEKHSALLRQQSLTLPSPDTVHFAAKKPNKIPAPRALPLKTQVKFKLQSAGFEKKRVGYLERPAVGEKPKVLRVFLDRTFVGFDETRDTHAVYRALLDLPTAVAARVDAKQDIGVFYAVRLGEGTSRKPYLRVEILTASPSDFASEFAG